MSVILTPLGGEGHKHAFARGTDAKVWAKAWTLVPAVDHMLQSMRDVSTSRGSNGVLGSSQNQNLPLLTDLDGNRDKLGANHVAVYFVRTTNPPPDVIDAKRVRLDASALTVNI